ncbi:MAG: helix-turn-helix transcriptional regulator [Caulobacter sp.]|nr:helix-turn-helix transcriptional regulator [Caulobacter sp.]
MTQGTSTPPTWSALLSQAVRLLRRARDLKVVDVAKAMGLKPRTYEHFESGQAQPSLARMEQFAQIADADPNGLIAALMIASPAFAVRSADNKLMTAFLIELQAFDQAAGDDIRRLDTLTLVTEFSGVFARLLEETRCRAELAARLQAGVTPPPEDG